MTRKLTRIRVPGRPIGDADLMDWDEHSRTDMVRQLRARMDHLRKVIELVDATADEAFEVDIVEGSAVQRFVRRVP